jgi:hypothetical protein
MLSVGRIIGILLLALLATVSTAGAAGGNPAAGLANRHNGYELKLAWQELQANGDVVVKGLIKNIRQNKVADLDVAVFLLDGQNRIVAADRTYPLPAPIVDHEYVPFNMTFRNMAADSTVQYVAFFIRYRNVDDLGWGNSSFRYDLASGKEIEEKSLYRDEW